MRAFLALMRQYGITSFDVKTSLACQRAIRKFRGIAVCLKSQHEMGVQGLHMQSHIISGLVVNKV
jgi:hypothetical protein